MADIDFNSDLGPGQLGSQAAPQMQQAASNFQGQMGPASASSGPLDPHQFVGKSADFASPISPLSPLQRAAFGNLKTPLHQMQYLRDTYGNENVDVKKMDDGASGFVVKSNDGTWRQVDPAGLSDIPNDLLHMHFGDALSRLKNFSASNTIGGLAQFIGEHKLDAPLGAAGAFIGSPLGPPGAILGGTLGAGIGGLADAGIRNKLFQIQQMTGTKIPGAEEVNHEQLHDQVMHSMFFGLTNEIAPRVLKMGAEGAAGLMGSAANKVLDTPSAKKAFGGLIETLGGLKPGLARAAADDYAGTLKLVPQAAKDAAEKTSVLDNQGQKMFTDFYDQALSAKRSLGKQYDAIDKGSASQRFNALADLKSGTNPIKDTIQELQEQRYVDASGQLVTPSAGDVTRDIGGANGVAINRFLSDFNAISKKGDNVSHKDLTIMGQNIQNYLEHGANPVTDDNLRRILTKGKIAINNVKSENLPPELSNLKASLDSKYGPVSDLMEDLSKSQEGAKYDTFKKKILKDDGSYNAQLMNSISSLVGVDNPTKQLLQIEAAKGLARGWSLGGGLNVLGLKLPTGAPLARGAMRVVGGWQDFTQAANENLVSPTKKMAYDAAAPAVKRMHQVYQAMPDTVKQGMMKSPEAISEIGKLMSGYGISEQQTKDNLLKQSGAFQDSQMNQQ